MQALQYDTTLTNVANLVSDFHINLPFGYAYETETHFVHFYGNKENAWYNIPPGLTVTQSKNYIDAPKNLLEWIEKKFGATNINTMLHNVGESIEGVWRPGLYYYSDSEQALKTTEQERRLSEQSLRVLLEKMDDILLYIEPDIVSFNTYSHKTRELLILACTEVENYWTLYLTKSGTKPSARNFTTNDYVKLLEPLFLKDYECSLKSYAQILPVKPFATWDSSKPSESLKWYQAYNKTKHNRTENFKDATFEQALNAVIATIIMYILRFSPYPMEEEKTTFNSLINQHFKFKLSTPNRSMFYIPLIKIPDNFQSNVFIFDSKEKDILQAFKVNPLQL